MLKTSKIINYTAGVQILRSGLNKMKNIAWLLVVIFLYQCDNNKSESLDIKLSRLKQLNSIKDICYKCTTTYDTVGLIYNRYPKSKLVVNCIVTNNFDSTRTYTYNLYTNRNLYDSIIKLALETCLYSAVAVSMDTILIHDSLLIRFPESPNSTQPVKFDQRDVLNDSIEAQIKRKGQIRSVFKCW